MRLIVGLGNPGDKYRKTFHNLGFLAAEDTAIALGMKLKKSECLALTTGKKGEAVIAKPQTYMNLSGESVKQLMKRYKVEPEDLLVIYDDADLPKGNIRLRAEGSAGTHNGMRNIVDRLDTMSFPRIRIGIGGERDIPIADYVLSNIHEEDFGLFSDALKKASEAAAEFAKGSDFSKIMQKYNTR